MAWTAIYRNCRARSGPQIPTHICPDGVVSSRTQTIFPLKPRSRNCTYPLATLTYIECLLKGSLFRSAILPMDTMNNGSSAEQPQALMLGRIYHAKDTFDRLCKTHGVKQITSGTRGQFLEECSSGIYSNVVAIARNVDSVQFTGLFDAELIAKLPSSVKFICHNGAGYDQIDVKACIERGISVSNTPSVVNDATADTAMLLLLAALRRAWIPQSALRNGLWDNTRPLGRDPKGLTLGILGMGGIGSAVAKRAAPFELKLQYHNQSPAKASVMSRLNLRDKEPKYVDFEELLRTSDIISVHVPLSARTRHLIGKKEIEMMKDNVIIINTARGPIIDEGALVEGLENGKIWSAGLDVFEEEPKIHPGLLKNENVIMLPHIGTATVDTRKHMEITMLDNVKNGLVFKQLLNPVLEHVQVA